MWGELVDSERLRAFVAFADATSFTGAAERLGRSQPAVHAQIKKLEEELGVDLYARRGRGVALTDEGRRLAAFGRRMMADTGLMLGRLRRQAAARVRLVAGGGVVRDLLAPGIAAFTRTGGRVDVEVSDGPGVLRAVSDGHAGLGATALAAPPVGLWARPLRTVGLALAAPAGWRKGSDRSLPIDVLVDLPLVLPPIGGPVRAALDASLEDAVLDVVVTCRGWDVALALVAAGVGFAVVNETCRAPAGVEIWSLEPGDLPTTRYWLLGRPRGPRGDGLRLAELLLAASADR